MYKHKPLEQPDHVRLILLLPGTFDEPLSCRLLHCQRTPSIPYVALSYVWGDSGFSNTLLVRGEPTDEDAVMPYMITCSLYKALQSLRPLYEPLFVWADQICINQLDNAEKSYQVAHMSSIYRNASSVTIWLGDYEGRHELEGLKRLAELWRMEPTEPYAVSVLESMLRDGTLSLQFFQRSWWTRTWTIQEFLLGRETEYRIGRHTIHEQEVRDACQIDSYSHYSPLADDSASDRLFASNKGSNLIDDMLEILRPNRTLFKWRDHLQLTQDVSLAKFVFDLSRDKLCGDNRDRIYALIGVANNKIALVPDYSLDENQVYYSFAISCLLSGDFSVLDECATVDIERHREILSFVPRLHLKPNRAQPFGTFRSFRSNEKLSAGCVFWAYTVACDHAGVSIRGVLLDTTAHSMGFPQEFGNGSDNKAIIHGGTPELYGFTTTKAALEGLECCLRWLESLDACTNTCTQGPLQSRHCLQPYCQEPFFYVYLRTITAGVVGNSRRFTDTSYCLWASRHYMRDRVLFMKSSGYLGLGPKFMKPQDRIVIFDGAKTPYVLRPYGNNYKVVGPCFVHGWMDGDYFGHAVLDPFSSPQKGGVDPIYAYVPPHHDGIKVLTKQDFCIY